MSTEDNKFPTIEKLIIKEIENLTLDIGILKDNLDFYMLINTNSEKIDNLKKIVDKKMNIYNNLSQKYEYLFEEL